MMLINDPEPYEKFIPHVDRVTYDHPVFETLARIPQTDEDFDNCKKAADQIAYQILGMLNEDGSVKQPEYWSNEEFKNLNPIQIEAKIIREQGRVNYGLDTKYGIPTYQHALVLTKLIFPKTDITPVLADITQLCFMNYSHGRKYLHLLGSQDSGKSSTIARLIFVFMVIDSTHTFAPVASPFVNTAETIIWGDILELYDQMCDAHPLGESGTTLFPNASVTNGRINFTSEGRGKAGWAGIRNLKKAGKLIGSKNIGSDTRVGVGIVAFDEINRSEGTGFESELSNVAGQDWFQMITAQNPVDETDVGGLFAEPKRWEGWGVASYDEVREEQPVIWPTVKSGIAYRLNGLDSVNMRLKKIVYPYQFNEKKHKRLLDDYGPNSPAYHSQCLALFPNDEVDMRLLSQSRLSASKHEEEDFAMSNIRGRVLFCDPAHTGHGDKAVIASAEFGEAQVTNTDGSQDEKTLLVFKRNMEHVTYDSSAVWSTNPEKSLDYFYNKFIEVGGNPNDLTMGAPVSYEQQIALRMALRAKKEGIPYENIGFDFSMRYEMMAAVSLIMGNRPVPFDYNTKAIGYYLQSTKENTEEKCPQRNGRVFELGHLTADLFNSKQVRGGNLIRVALIQTCKTKIIQDKPHKPFEDKATYRARNENKSPDERDALFGVVGMAYLRGFRAEKTATAKSKGESVFRRLLQKNKKKRKTVKRF